MNEWEIEYSIDCLTTMKSDLNEILRHINPADGYELTLERRYCLREVLGDALIQISFLEQALETDTDPNPKKKFRLFKRK